MNDNPNWQPLLAEIPPEFHPMIKPMLAEWDKGVQDKINSLHETYKPFKFLVDNKLTPELVNEALSVHHQLSQNPETFVRRVDEVMNLNLFNNPPAPSQASNGNPEFEIGEEFEGFDITKHPAFKQIAESLEALQAAQNQSAQEAEEARQVAEFEAYLDQLEEEHKESGGFNRMFVTAVMSQGVSAEDAIKQWQDTLAGALGTNPEIQQQLNQNVPQEQGGENNATPPNVMGSSGTAGGGLPNEAINPASLNQTQLDEIVANMLRADAEGG